MEKIQYLMVDEKEMMVTVLNFYLQAILQSRDIGLTHSQQKNVFESPRFVSFSAHGVHRCEHEKRRENS
jgi:hypothetical protein